MYRSTYPIGEFSLGNLPNIKGGFAGVYNSLGNQGAISANYSINNELPQACVVTDGYYAQYYFNAHQSNSVYQDDVTAVYPTSVNMYQIIKY